MHQPPPLPSDPSRPLQVVTAISALSASAYSAAVSWLDHQNPSMAFGAACAPLIVALLIVGLLSFSKPLRSAQVRFTVVLVVSLFFLVGPIAAVWRKVVAFAW